MNLYACAWLRSRARVTFGFAAGLIVQNHLKKLGLSNISSEEIIGMRDYLCKRKSPNEVANLRQVKQKANNHNKTHPVFFPGDEIAW